ncbi:beta-N-acetylhexosaminidase [Halotalea alkalilenta]|uniref:beta-N-acetylhexosaminidase n=1 Tax=Halotalea alkalilenta TaxID=376489 RepID=UPI0004843550|nr:beta-N-acetylhexosaminidase [Halotalea alkalilenta]
MSAQLGPVMLDLASMALDDEERELLMHPAVGGVILFTRNLESPAQARALCESIRELRPQLLIAVDHEGGRVQRLRTGVTRLPPMAAFDRLHAEAPESTLALLRDTGWLMGLELAACGFDFSFAPVLDVDDDRCPAIGDRAFSADPERVALLAGALVDGLDEAGMVALGKHYPGHGGVDVDSHHELPVDPRPFEALRAHDLVPFERLSPRLGGVMPSHVRYTAFDDQPAGFSVRWLEYLRSELGFRGAVLSDDLGMQGAHFAGSPADRARRALEAGCDMVLICNDRAAALAVLEAVSYDPVRSRRLNALRYDHPRPDLGSVDALGRWRTTHVRLEQLAEEHGY